MIYKLLAIICALCAIQPILTMQQEALEHQVINVPKQNDSDDSSSSSHSAGASECSSECSDEDDLDSEELADILADTEQTRSPLMNAALAGNYGLCKELLMAGASVNRKTFIVGKTALHCAKQANHAPILKLLLAHGANPYCTYLGEEAEQTIAGSGISQTTQIIKDHKTILTTLFAACVNGNIPLVELILQKYRIVNVASEAQNAGHKYRACTPLMIAAAKGHTELCQLLLCYGADPKIDDQEYVPATARSIDLFGLGSHKATALTYAQKYGHPEIVTLLENHRYNPLSLKQLALYELHDQLDAGTITSEYLAAELPSHLAEEACFKEKESK